VGIVHHNLVFALLLYGVHTTCGCSGAAEHGHKEGSCFFYTCSWRVANFGSPTGRVGSAAVRVASEVTTKVSGPPLPASGRKQQQEQLVSALLQQGAQVDAACIIRDKQQERSASVTRQEKLMDSEWVDEVQTS
jgi:hypothetical protein